MTRLIPCVFNYEQLTPSDEWVIEHNLSGNGSSGYPVVDVLIDQDNALKKIMCGVQVIDSNTVKLIFSKPFTGKAVIVI